MTSVRAAAVQDSPVLLGREATLDRVDELTDRAAGQGAQLVVFPEAFVPGPPVWIDALPVGDDAEWHALLMRESVTVPGPACDRLAASARRAGVVLVVGVNEREDHGGTVVNTVLTFGPAGELLGRHRKLIPAHAERWFGGWATARTSTCSTRQPDGSRRSSVGRTTCRWRAFTSTRRAPRCGSRRRSLPSASGWRACVISLAKAPLCFVLGVAPVMHPDWLPGSLPDATPLREDAAQFDGWLLEGYSVIVAPTGELLAGPLVRERGILIADLDLGSLPARKRLFDPTGHYNRPDVFRVTVDDSPKPSVVVEPFSADHQR